MKDQRCKDPFALIVCMALVLVIGMILGVLLYDDGVRVLQGWCR